MLLNNGLKNPCDVFDKINIKYLLMEQMHHRRLQIEFSGNCFCGYVCIVCRIFPTTFCLLYTYLSLKTKNAEILVYHSKKKNQYIFFIYVYSFTQINWQEKINFSYGFMIIKSDIFYSFGNSRSTLPYFFLTESLNQAYKRFQNILPVVVLRLFFILMLKLVNAWSLDTEVFM